MIDPDGNALHAAGVTLTGMADDALRVSIDLFSGAVDVSGALLTAVRIKDPLDGQMRAVKRIEYEDGRIIQMRFSELGVLVA